MTFACILCIYYITEPLRTAGIFIYSSAVTKGLSISSVPSAGEMVNKEVHLTTTKPNCLVSLVKMLSSSESKCDVSNNSTNVNKRSTIMNSQCELIKNDISPISLLCLM